jgi:hypothetical protein
VVDAGSWLDSRRVLISPVAVNKPEWEKKLLPVALTKEQVRNSPGIDTNKPVSRQHEMELTQYYGWPYYWTAAVPGPAPITVPTPALGTAPGPAVTGPVGERDRASSASGGVATEEGDPHLHSVHSVRGYHIKATDGPIGHVDDFLVDDQSWEITHLVIDTRNWWPGKKVILSPQWIIGVSWEESEVAVDLSRDFIKRSPEYDPGRALDTDYVDRLHDHYGKSRYEKR